MKIYSIIKFSSDIEANMAMLCFFVVVFIYFDLIFHYGFLQFFPVSNGNAIFGFDMTSVYIHVNHSIFFLIFLLTRFIVFIFLFYDFYFNLFNIFFFVVVVAHKLIRRFRRLLYYSLFVECFSFKITFMNLQYLNLIQLFSM